MRTFLSTCFLATFVAAGESVQCEQCFGLGYNCEGPLMDCHLEEGTCGTMHLRSSGLFETEITQKTCFTSRSCNETHGSLDFGIAGQMLGRVTCCTGKECEAIPPLPPINTTPNGRKCPACYSVQKHDCKGIVAECTGDNIYCAEIRATRDLGLQNISIVLKGCTNYDVCRDTTQGYPLDTLAINECVISSGPRSTIPGSSLLFFQIFSGWLLLKILL